MPEYGLGRLPQPDARNLNYPIRTLLPTRQPRSYTWRVGVNLDQGSEGACVGFGWAHELAARPVVVAEVSNQLGFDLYREARRLDQWSGEDYEGTSVIAGAKTCLRRGHMSEYRWAFTEPDLALAVGYKGPVVLGLNWYSGMFWPDYDGFLQPTGRLEGGHCILAYSINVKRGFYRLWNSWGHGWGDLGTAKITRDDMAGLLAEEGDACIPIRTRI
ncbi:MAG TPA: C1 family peptidase [Jiangellaceae bacterium]|nr:C1 family peptidase [Jiangellaceae bacterium]